MYAYTLCDLFQMCRKNLNILILLSLTIPNWYTIYFTVLGRQGSSESGEGNWSLDNNKSSGEDDLMTSSLDMASFEEVTQDMCQEKSLYLFARCDREKDDW